MKPADLLPAVFGLLAAALGGLAFTLAGLPLSWIIGAMAGAALYGNISPRTVTTRNWRRAGQLVLGTATAGVLDPDILAAMVELLPVMIGAAVSANVVGILLAWPFAALTGVDRQTAMLSSLPAGMAEMSSLAKEIGARAEIVTVVHTLRVILVVLLVPLIVGGTRQIPGDVDSDGSWAALVFCFASGLALAVLADRIRLLNPFIIMPMLVGVIMVSVGFPVMPMPLPLLIAAQILIGFSLGSRLKLDDFRQMPRPAFTGLFCSLVLIGAMTLLVAPLLGRWSDIDIASLTLGVAPGGLGEMIASAKSVGVSAAVVAGFQFTRSFLTNMIVPQVVIRIGRPKGGAKP